MPAVRVNNVHDELMKASKPTRKLQGDDGDDGDECLCACSCFFFTVVPAEAHDGLGSTVDGQRGTDICVALAPRLEDAYIDCFRSVFRGPP